MDAKLETKDVSKMSNEQLDEMLIYINRIQWIILDEKQKRECCIICGDSPTKFVLLLPCRHQKICKHCCDKDTFTHCPICNQIVTNKITPRTR